jgi:acetolactate synthase I/III small subunit
MPDPIPSPTFREAPEMVCHLSNDKPSAIPSGTCQLLVDKPSGDPPSPARASIFGGVCHLLNDKPPAATSGECQLLVDKLSAAPSSFVAGENPENVCHLLNDKLPAAKTAVLELRVRNHPGTMSHITGLFARRGFNLEAIVCAPVDDGATSCMLLLVAAEPRLEQVERQLAKLYDVLTVRHRPDLRGEFFYQLVPSSAGGTGGGSNGAP